MATCPSCKTENLDSAVSCAKCSADMPSVEWETIQTVDPSAIRLGSDFGPRYRIEALLGQGGMGRVYKAYDKELSRTVAIKVVRPGMMGEEDALGRFKQELVLASKISHKNILRIHDLGEVNGMKFISMAYVEGQDLYQIMKVNPKLPLDRVLKYATQLAGALAAAHAEDVVHRDLKPQNILVDKNDQIYVADFGLARSFAEGAVGMTQGGAFLGTPRYMSPEQVQGKPTDGRSDLYAYGIILYEMVTGEAPFAGESTLQVMYQRILVKPKSPKLLNPELPPYLVRIIMRCMEVAPADRYQSGYEILADLQASQSPSGLSRKGSTVQIRIPELVNRRWVRAALGSVLLLALMFAIPPVRHLIFGGSKSGGGSSISGVPALADGRFVAVLSFDILGDANQFGYLAQGIQEALTTKLFQLKEIHVTSTDEAAKADVKQPMEKIARALGANLLVRGTLQGSADKIRVTVHVDDVADKKRIWTKEFDSVTADLLTLEDQISSQLITALDINPSNDEQAKLGARQTDNMAAYDAYLRGRNSLRSHEVKNVQAALDYFDQALKADPRFALAYAGIADASLRMNSIKKDNLWIQKALAAAQQAQQINNNLPEVHTTLGSAYSASGKYAEATSELKRALSLAPNSDEAYRHLGATYLKSGNGPAAIEALQKAIQLNPYYWVNQDSLGNAYFQLGDYPKALAAFQQITVLEPDIDAGYENVGIVYMQQGKNQESIPYFQKALKIEPYFTTYSNLGTAYFGLKQFPQAVEMFEKALALAPNETTVAVNLADARRSAGQKDKARDAYQHAIALGFKELQTNPQDASAMTQIALAYANLGDKQAETFITRARAIDKNSVDYIYSQAEVDALLGKTSEALRSLQDALEKHYPAESAEQDEELDNLRTSPEFAALIKKYTTKK
jgi:eukaryotic-like serine/threonine-protein kinase